MRYCNQNDLKYFEKDIKAEIKVDLIDNIEKYICLNDPKELKFTSVRDKFNTSEQMGITVLLLDCG